MPPDGGTMKKTYFWTVLAGMLYAGSSFVMSLGVSNVLGAAAAGIFAIAMSIGNQLVTIGYYNMRTFQVSDVLEKYSFGDYCASRLITTAAMAVVGVIWIAAGGYPRMSDKDTSCYIYTPHGDTHSDNTQHSHTLFSFFPAIPTTEHGEQSRVRAEKPHSEAAQDFFRSELAKPLTASECGVTFAD